MSDQVRVYVLNGKPIRLKRARSSKRYYDLVVYDSQKQEKFIDSTALRSQHDNDPLIKEGCHLDVTFFMALPKNKKHKPGDPHIYRPDISNLLKYIEDVATGIIIHDDCLISSVSARKVYDHKPRTEFSFRMHSGK